MGRSIEKFKIFRSIDQTVFSMAFTKIKRFGEIFNLKKIAFETKISPPTKCQAILVGLISPTA